MELQGLRHFVCFVRRGLHGGRHFVLVGLGQRMYCPRSESFLPFVIATNADELPESFQLAPAAREHEWLRSFSICRNLTFFAAVCKYVVRWHMPWLRPTSPLFCTLLANHDLMIVGVITHLIRFPRLWSPSDKQTDMNIHGYCTKLTDISAWFPTCI